MEILITGGLGFVGGRLALHFAKQGNKVNVATRGNPKKTKLANNIFVEKIDWNNFDSICSSVGNADIIIHAAGPSSSECTKSPSEATKFLRASTIDLLKSAQRNKVKKIVYLSTCHVYNDHLSGLITEDHVPQNKHPYAIANLSGEDALIDSESKFGVCGIILRLSNLFGFPMYPNKSCWDLFANQMVREAYLNRCMEIKGGGEDRRDFMPMISACEKIQYAIENLSKLKKINISSGKSYTTLEFANIIKEYLKSSHKLDIDILTKIGVSQAIDSLNLKSKYYNSENIDSNHIGYEISEMINYLKYYEF